MLAIWRQFINYLGKPQLVLSTICMKPRIEFRPRLHGLLLNPDLPPISPKSIKIANRYLLDCRNHTCPALPPIQRHQHQRENPFSVWPAVSRHSKQASSAGTEGKADAEPDVAGAVIAVAHPLGVAHAPTGGVCFHSVYFIARSSRARRLWKCC